MNCSKKLVSLLKAVFSKAARFHFPSAQKIGSEDGNHVGAAPGLFYRGGLPVNPGFGLAFARALRRDGNIAVFVIANALPDAQTEAVTDVSMALIQ